MRKKAVAALLYFSILPGSMLALIWWTHGLHSMLREV